MDNQPDSQKEKQELYSASAMDHTLAERNFISHGKGVPDHLSIASTINDRSGFNRHDFYEKRKDQAIPTDHASIVASCQAIYRKIGLIRNVIDLMADFASEGLDLSHPVKRQERFYRKWAQKVKLADRANNFMRLLLRDANVIIRRKMASLTIPAFKDMSKAFMGFRSVQPLGLPVVEDVVKEMPEKITKDKKGKRLKKEIPWKYTFLQPTRIKKISGEVGGFFGDDEVAIELSAALIKSIKSPQTKAEKDFVDKLPAEIISAVTGLNKSSPSVLIKLNKENIYIDYYKKDDWQEWGTPFLYGILEDVLFKEKMRLADMSALDGVIDVIRLWKLGNSEQKIFPTPAAVNKLIDILQHNTGGGVMDLVWDDMIQLQTNYPPTDKILGPEKYRSVDRDILQGLGVPDSLIGGSDLGTRNAQSAFVQLKTLKERLEYVRSRALAWMENELRMVAVAMNFKDIPVINFSNMSLRDEAAEKLLIMNLLDRNVISVESVQKTFGFDFMIELQRMKDERDIRDKDKPVLEKAGPFYRPESVMKLQEEVQKDGPGGENFVGDLPKTEEVSSPGRPNNDVEIGPRDERTNPVLSVYKTIASDFMCRIDNIVDPKYLLDKGVSTLRSLNKEDKVMLEKLKYTLLALSIDCEQINESIIKNKLSSGNHDIIGKFFSFYEYLCSQFLQMLGKNPSIKDRRSLAKSAWSILKYNRVIKHGL